jgi:D-alanyl-D-alanine carboxypeptidase
MRAVCKGLSPIPARRTQHSRRRGSLFLAGTLFLGASASWAGDGRMSGQRSGDKPLDAATQTAVEQIVRQFQETNHTPGVLVGIWSPKGTFVRI